MTKNTAVDDEQTDAEQSAAVNSIIAAALPAAEASFEELMAKPRRAARFPITLANLDGDAVVKKIKYLALSPEQFDALVAQHPPTAKQKESGASWNVDTFAPALISAVSSVPKLTPAQAKQLYTNPNYATGEQRELFFQALDVCGGGLATPFTEGA